MVDLAMATAITATIATFLMMVAMLWFVWDAMGKDQHRPGGPEEAPVPDDEKAA